MIENKPGSHNIRCCFVLNEVTKDEIGLKLFIDNFNLAKDDVL